MRMCMRRFTGLTNAFSKKIENHAHAVALHFMKYIYCRTHQSLKVTAAMAAGVSDTLWEIEDIVSMSDKYHDERSNCLTTENFDYIEELIKCSILWI